MLRNVQDYPLEVLNSPKKQTQITCSASFSIPFNSPNNDSVIKLWHYRLGHPNFLYLKNLFPKLFKNSNAKSFQCQICQLSKHARTSFP